MELPPPVADVPAAFTAAVTKAFTERPGPRFVLVLSGGPTARACYEHLAAASATGEHAAGQRGSIDWSAVDIYMGDERYVPPDDDDANQRLVRESLLSAVGDHATFTPMPTTLPIEECVASYQATMAELLADGGPGIDLIHLGLGPDGHTASLFPGDTTLDLPPSQLTAATKDPNGNNPHERLTLTLPAINAARLAVFTVTGASKADAVAALRRGDDIPAARVHAERVHWLLDAAAATPSP